MHNSYQLILLFSKICRLPRKKLVKKLVNWSRALNSNKQEKKKMHKNRKFKRLKCFQGCSGLLE